MPDGGTGRSPVEGGHRADHGRSRSAERAGADPVDLMGLRPRSQTHGVDVTGDSAVGEPFPARGHCRPPRPGPRRSRSVPLPPPVGEVAGLVQLPNIGAGRAAVPDLAQACWGRARRCWVGAHLAVVPIHPVPVIIGHARSRPGARDRWKRDMCCMGAAHVPGSLIKAVVDGVGKRHHSQMSGTRQEGSRRGPAWARSGTAAGATTSLGSSANRTTPRHRRSGRALGRLRVTVGRGVGQWPRAGNGAPTATRPTREEPPRGAATCSHPRTRLTRPVDGVRGRGRGASVEERQVGTRCPVEARSCAPVQPAPPSKWGACPRASPARPACASPGTRPCLPWRPGTATGRP
ncbi:hypothetical protein FB558_1745 [Pseudonocardia kunmingensis]|uniref:Uncharacterized protein n=1 Tax=Pseudonocardia kunmingensis TaxID=630975 RepID=A0A543E057_9PSEU|nr:hypothetical protein FB558_1745 [Pseudonocardia kunmingensis]